jgi:hypothetical protein
MKLTAVLSFIAGEKWAVGNEPLLIKRNELIQRSIELDLSTQDVLANFSKLIKETDWCDGRQALKGGE